MHKCRPCFFHQLCVCVSLWLSELKMSMHTMTIKPCATKTRFAHGLVWLHFRMGVKDLQSRTRSKVCPLALMSRRVGTQYRPSDIRWHSIFSESTLSFKFRAEEEDSRTSSTWCMQSINRSAQSVHWAPCDPKHTATVVQLKSCATPAKEFCIRLKTSKNHSKKTGEMYVETQGKA